MRARVSAASRVDLDWIEGSLEMAESTLMSVPAYHAGWSSLHPDDQVEFLAAFPLVEQCLAQLVLLRSNHQLEPDHAQRMEALLALKGVADPLLAELCRPQTAPSGTPTRSGHPMVLDD